jgi:hypothetical protein
MVGADRVDRGGFIDDPPAEWDDHVWAEVRQLRELTPAWMWPDVDVTTLLQPPAIAAYPLPPPAKFRRLYEWLKAQSANEVSVERSQLEELVDGGLPAGATTGVCAGEWWTNNPRRPQARAWVNAGYLVTSSPRSGDLVLVRGRKRVPTRAEVVSERLIRMRHVTECSTSVHSTHKLNRPTSVYLVHMPRPGLYKVGIATDAAKRIRAQRNDRQITTVQILDVRHRQCAYAVEAIVLNLTEPWRVIDDRWRSVAGGALETWSDEGPVPDLRDVADRLNPAIAVE